MGKLASYGLMQLLEKRSIGETNMYALWVFGIRVHGYMRKLMIHRNNNGWHSEFFISDDSDGEGCASIWYPSLDVAKKEVERLFESEEKIVSGRESGLCRQCGDGKLARCINFKKQHITKIMDH